MKSPNTRKARAVYQVTDVCRILGKSRRQVYRDLKDGFLIEAGRVLGVILVDVDSVKRVQNQPAQPHRIPANLGRLFPEYDVDQLNAGRDRTVVLARILEDGTLSDLKWMRRRYSVGDLRRFIELDGERLLSARSHAFWVSVLGSKRRLSSKRMSGDNPWGQR